jgi:hypothetical protein
MPRFLGLSDYDTVSYEQWSFRYEDGYGLSWLPIMLQSDVNSAIWYVLHLEITCDTWDCD